MQTFQAARAVVTLFTCRYNLKYQVSGANGSAHYVRCEKKFGGCGAVLFWESTNQSAKPKAKPKARPISLEQQIRQLNRAE